MTTPSVKELPQVLEHTSLDDFCDEPLAPSAGPRPAIEWSPRVRGLLRDDA